MTNQYNRYFINLYQEDSYCTINSKEAIGRCRIETKADKAKIYIWIQNLKQNTYDVYLISANENKCENILIGQLSSDSHGYAELNFNFMPDNILNTNISIDKINVVAITPKNKKSIVVLNGYKNSKIKWRNLFITDEQNENVENKPESQKETETTNLKNESNTDNNSLVQKQSQICNDTENSIQNSNIKPDNNDNFKAIAQKISKELEQLQNYKFITEEELINLKPKNTNIDFIFNNNLKMSPFEKQNKNINWVRLSIRELINLPIDFWLYANHPFILSAYYKNKHMIFGVDNQKDEYILGLPDKYQPEYKGVLKKLGFLQFKCCKDKKPIRDDYGYWLMPIYF